MTGEAVETQEAPPAEKLAAVLGAAVLGAADAAVGMAQGVTLEVGERLNEDLDMARVKQIRGKDYLAVHDVIRTANRIFGFGRWGHEVVELASIGSTPKTAEDGRTGVYVGYRCTVRLTVAGCLPVCGVGYGDGVEYQEQSAVTAHELAVKEAESDALKRAFRNFGDQFGLILYAKADEKKRIAAEKATEGAERIANDPEAREKLDGEKRADLIHTWANKETPSKPAHARTVQDVLDLAARVGDEERTKAERAIAEHREKYLGLVDDLWLGRMRAALEGMLPADAMSAPEGDRWVTDDEIDAVRELATQADMLAAFEEALGRERAGHLLNARGSWLKEQMAGVMRKLNDKGDFAPPADAGVTPPVEDEDVAAAFGQTAA